VRDGQGLVGLRRVLQTKCDVLGASRTIGGRENARTVHGLDEGDSNRLPDGHYEVRSFATDIDRNNVAAYGIF